MEEVRQIFFPLEQRLVFCAGPLCGKKEAVEIPRDIFAKIRESPRGGGRSS